MRYLLGQPDPLPDMIPTDTDDTSLIKDLCLNWTEQQTQDFLAGIPMEEHAALSPDQIVPPEAAWALDPDTRPGVAKWLMESHERTGAGESGETRSVILKDKHTGEIVGIVIRNFIGVPSVVARMDEAAKAHVLIGRNARRDDAGTMAQYGYTGGARRDRSFAWMVSAHTLIFNIAAKKVPTPIIEGFKAASEEMPRIDWNMMGVPITSRVSTNYHGRNHDLTGLELGPASGVCAATYARRCHSEQAPPECPWVMSFTRTCNHSGLGGDFYFANIGIRVEQAANTLIVHDGTEFHGTMVHDVNWDPRNLGGNSKERKEPPIKWDTDPEELLEYRGFSLLIPFDLRAIYQKGTQAQAAAPAARPSSGHSPRGPSVGNGDQSDATVDAWDEDRMDIDG
ncbi:hypothetical protein MMC30_008170 [Trapelia coarctata]|nr:hypothetical protein [Trapelia coarctata]